MVGFFGKRPALGGLLAAYWPLVVLAAVLAALGLGLRGVAAGAGRGAGGGAGPVGGGSAPARRDAAGRR